MDFTLSIAAQLADLNALLLMKELRDSGVIDGEVYKAFLTEAYYGLTKGGKGKEEEP